MPKVSDARNAAAYIAGKCETVIGDKNTLIGHTHDVNDDGKVTVIAYYTEPNKLMNPKAMVITDRDVIRAALKPETAPIVIGAKAETPEPETKNPKK